jgi:diguanylate cyclase (GGDEF)-like protein/PAS domain S-box-containing protein
MKPESPSPSSASEEVFSLIETLSKTDCRLEELTSGQLDTVRDVGGQTFVLRLAQEALMQSGDARQAAILNALPAHIALLDAEGMIVAVNDSWKSFADANALKSPQYGIGLNYLEICDIAVEEDETSNAHSVAHGIRSVLEYEATSFSIEYACHSPNEQRWFQLVVTPLYKDVLLGAVVMHINTTERKLTENALRESNQKFEQLTANISDAFWVWSADLRELHYVSPAFERIWGRSVESLYDNPQGWTDFILPEDRNRALVGFVGLAGEVRSAEIEYRIVRPDGEIRWIRFRGFQVRDDADKLIRISGVVTDITEPHHVAKALRDSLEEFRTLAEALPQMVWITDPTGANIYSNQQWTNYTGQTTEEGFGHGWMKPFHPDDQQRTSKEWQRATAVKGVYVIESRIRRFDGVYRWWLIRGVPLQNAAGEILKWFGTSTDIHDLKMTEEALFLEKESAQVRLNSIGDCVVCADISGNVSFFNSVAEKMIDCSFQEATGKPVAEILRIKYPASNKNISDQLATAVENDRTVQLQPNCILIRRDGFEIPIEGSVAPIHDRDGRVTGSVVVVRDVSVTRSMALQILHLAEHDSLTGLPNRSLLNDRINQAIALAARYEKQVAVLFLDLDGFKHINDSLGHPIGDRLLQSIGNCLLSCVRATDTVSRQGGDEFIVLLSELEHPEDAAITARRILDAVSEPRSIDLYDLRVTASIGVSVYPDDGLNAETLIKSADIAMYQAKENDRQGYQFFKPAMNIKAVERQSIEVALREALKRQEFALHYQAKVNLKTGNITGAEALLRWTHPIRGQVSPAQFIPIAEDSGLILPIGSWVLREACKQVRSWADAGLPMTTIAVNISAIELRQATFLKTFFDILKETGVDPTFLELELTESVLMKRVESAASVLRELRAKGVKIAIDDFGTGYSSLSYLRKFPIDALKIDQSFVRQITALDNDTTIVSAIISMGRSMKLRVIAEGVETSEELAFLQAQQCDEAQGYFFSRPVPASEFAKLLRNGVFEKLTV